MRSYYYDIPLTDQQIIFQYTYTRAMATNYDNQDIPEDIEIVRADYRGIDVLPVLHIETVEEATEAILNELNQGF